MILWESIWRCKPHPGTPCFLLNIHFLLHHSSYTYIAGFIFTHHAVSHFLSLAKDRFNLLYFLLLSYSVQLVIAYVRKWFCKGNCEHKYFFLAFWFAKSTRKKCDSTTWKWQVFFFIKPRSSSIGVTSWVINACLYAITIFYLHFSCSTNLKESVQTLFPVQSLLRRLSRTIYTLTYVYIAPYVK